VALLSHVEERVANNDYTIRSWGKRYQIAREGIGPGLRGAVVRVEERPGGRLTVRFGNGYLRITPCEPPARLAEEVKSCPPAHPPRASKPGRERFWMKSFYLRQSLLLWAVLKQEGGR
jgi:hypothetical protein